MEEREGQKRKEDCPESRLASASVFRLLLRMAIPTMLSMLIQSLYNIVDSIFVTRLGEQPLHAVSLVYPLQNLVLAVAVGVGVGLNSCISRAIGAKRMGDADSFATLGFVISAVNSVLFLAAGLFLTTPFLRCFTADPVVLQLGTQYGTIVVGMAFFSLFHIAIEKLFQATGRTTFPMFMQALGAVVNLVLDPLLIYGIWIFPELGVKGAAIATVVGQACSCLVTVLVFFAGKNGLHVRFRGFRIRAAQLRAVFAVAAPSALMMALPSVLVGIMNALLGTVSETAVNFFGIYYKLQTLIYVPASGLVQGMRPIVGYYCGARDWKSLHRTVLFSLAVVGAFILLGTVLFFCFPGSIMALFGRDPERDAIAVPALRIFSIGFPVSTFGVILSGVFEAVGRGGKSLAVSMVRQFLLIPTLSFALLPVFGLPAVWWTYPISELLAAVLGMFFYVRFLRGARRADGQRGTEYPQGT